MRKVFNIVNIYALCIHIINGKLGGLTIDKIVFFCRARKSLDSVLSDNDLVIWMLTCRLIVNLQTSFLIIEMIYIMTVDAGII